MPEAKIFYLPIQDTSRKSDPAMPNEAQYEKSLHTLHAILGTGILNESSTLIFIQRHANTYGKTEEQIREDLSNIKEFDQKA